MSCVPNNPLRKCENPNDLIILGKNGSNVPTPNRSYSNNSYNVSYVTHDCATRRNYTIDSYIYSNITYR